MFVWWKSATHLFTIGYLWVCLAFLIQLLLHVFLQPQVRQHYFSPLSAFPLLFPLFMKSNWFFVFVFFATSNLLVFPGERLFKKSDLPLFSCKCAKENYRYLTWKRGNTSMKQRDESTHSSKLNNETVSYFYCIFFITAHCYAIVYHGT